MWSSVIVVHAPRSHDRTSLREGSKPVLVQTLVPKLPVEAFHVSVLRRLAGLDEPQFDAVLVSPLIECFAGELRSLISPDRSGPPPESNRAIEYPRDVDAGDAVIDDDVDRLLAEIIDNRQALQPPTVLEHIAQ